MVSTTSASRSSYPKLTGVRVPRHEIGILATALLVKHVEAARAGDAVNQAVIDERGFRRPPWAPHLDSPSGACGSHLRTLLLLSHKPS